MRWLVAVCLLAACEPPTVTVCENRGSDPTGERGWCSFCDKDFGAACGDNCIGDGCRCTDRAPDPMGPPTFHDADCSACGLYCEAPQIPCGARCVGPDEACPDRPSPWACRTREVPVE